MKIKEFAITSRSNPLVIETVKLQKKRDRDELGRFLADGRKLCYEYIKKCGKPFCLFVSEEHMELILPELEEIETQYGLSLEVTPVTKSVFTKLTQQTAPDGVILIGETNTLSYTKDTFDVRECERIIILDSLQDPGNVGTVIRTALALGYDRVILSDKSADVLNPKTLRASMGALFSLQISVATSLVDLISALRESGRRVYAAELRDNALSLDEISIDETDVFVIGNEGHGISEEVSFLCDNSVYIPISEKSESLNAAIAATVLMWQQRASFQ